MAPFFGRLSIPTLLNKGLEYLLSIFQGKWNGLFLKFAALRPKHFLRAVCSNNCYITFAKRTINIGFLHDSINQMCLAAEMAFKELSLEPLFRVVSELLETEEC